jgi:hypothetical protein
MKILRSCALVASVALVGTLTSCEGPTGPAGEAGMPGLSAVQVVSAEITLASNAFATIRAECPADKRAISGGYSVDGDGAQFVTAWQSYPAGVNAWAVALRNGFAGPLRVTAYAVCATVN